jgi:RHS repeat-associated protein
MKRGRPEVRLRVVADKQHQQQEVLYEGSVHGHPSPCKTLRDRGDQPSKLENEAPAFPRYLALPGIAFFLTEVYRYDSNGNVTNFVDRRNIAITFKHDALDRRTGVVYAANDSVRYFYDRVGRVTNINDSIAGNIRLTYDSLDRLTQEFNNNGTVTYAYNDVGLRTNMTVTGENTVFYRYDAANRLTNVTQGTFTTSLFYDDAGRRTRLTLPNGINVLYFYDKASRLTNITYQAAVTNRIDYAYDQTGNRVAQSSALATYPLPLAVTNSSYNAANQQLVFGSYQMLYDAAGNVTNIVSGTTTNRLLWSARNQLTNMLGAVSATFRYDGLGRRQLRTVNTVTENYLYDGLDIIIQKDSAGNVRGRYLRGLAIDEPWQRIDITPAQGNQTTTTNRIYLADALGSIVALTDTGRVITTEYDYEPFGATTTTGAANKNAYKFTAREDDSTGLYYYRARYYHPALGRFVSEDPMQYFGGDFNLYAYVWNDPMVSIDPIGLAGVQFGTVKIGIGDPWLIFNQDSWGDLGRGIAATADGIIPFGDPFSGYYDPCDPVYASSRALGALGRDLLVTLEVDGSCWTVFCTV